MFCFGRYFFFDFDRVFYCSQLKFGFDCVLLFKIELNFVFCPDDHGSSYPLELMELGQNSHPVHGLTAYRREKERAKYVFFINVVNFHVKDVFWTCEIILFTKNMFEISLSNFNRESPRARVRRLRLFMRRDRIASRELVRLRRLRRRSLVSGRTRRRSRRTRRVRNSFLLSLN